VVNTDIDAYNLSRNKTPVYFKLYTKTRLSYDGKLVRGISYSTGGKLIDRRIRVAFVTAA